MKYPDIIKYKAKNFPFAPQTNIADDFSAYMKEIRPDSYTQTKKLICDWSDKKNSLIYCRMLRFYVRHGLEVEKVHTVNSFKHSRWLGNHVNFITRKQNRAKNDFQKDF